jgi:hypothetical protein
MRHDADGGERPGLVEMLGFIPIIFARSSIVMGFLRRRSRVIASSREGVGLSPTGDIGHSCPVLCFGPSAPAAMSRATRWPYEVERRSVAVLPSAGVKGGAPTWH